MAELMYRGNISKVGSITGKQSTVKHDTLGSHKKFHKMSDTSRTTKEIEEILAPLEKAKNLLSF